MDWIGAKVDWIKKIRFFAHPYKVGSLVWASMWQWQCTNSRLGEAFLA